MPPKLRKKSGSATPDTGTSSASSATSSTSDSGSSSDDDSDSSSSSATTSTTPAPPPAKRDVKEISIPPVATRPRAPPRGPPPLISQRAAIYTDDSSEDSSSKANKSPSRKAKLAVEKSKPSGKIDFDAIANKPPPPKLLPPRPGRPPKGTVLKKPPRLSAVSSPNRGITPPPPKLVAMRNFPPQKPRGRGRGRPAKLKKATFSASDKSSLSSSFSSDSSDGERGVKKLTAAQKKKISREITQTAKTGRGRGRPRKIKPPPTLTPAPASDMKKSNIKATEMNKQKASTSVSNSDKPPHLPAASVPPPSHRPKLRKRFSVDTDSEEEDTIRIKPSIPAAAIKLEKASKVNSKVTSREEKAGGGGGGAILSGSEKCPVEGCDSKGHLNGVLPKHFIVEACPLYHNLTPKLCKQLREERLHRLELIENAVRERMEKTQASEGNKDGAVPPPPSDELENKLRAMVEKPASEPALETEESKPNVAVANKHHKQPDLWKCNVPAFEIRMFQDAQAVAATRLRKEMENLPPNCGIRYIELGPYEISVWYQSPLPEEYTATPKLYICEYCLRYIKYRTAFISHDAKCTWKHPPGEEIYRKDRLSVWEVDGKKTKTYAQNLCLLAKFFLDHKTLYYDVEPFMFYIMTVCDKKGCHVVGYFSKEKNSFLNFNVSCILTLPPYQRQGYGRLLIEFSYLLTKTEGKVGSPEKPLSDLGLISYRSYWKDAILSHLCSHGEGSITIKELSKELAINTYDIVSTLQSLGMMKYWKGKHIILRKPELLNEYRERTKSRRPVFSIDPAYLKWRPPNMPNLNSQENN